MGTTLENGVYLPSEGERNCYAGLKTNWEILDQKVADVTALQQAVAGALHREIVESLPTTDIDPNTIYMILSGTSATENVYNEYMYVNNAWELIGTSATDLTNYYTKAEVDGKLLLKASASDLTSHTGDTTIHVTASDKAKWNNQTYVLRYSSTTLVASSTNSNALLDNTDNLKVGDKVLDSSGNIYVVTAIDTANSTFTIGTSLIDLAQDSDVVHKSGDETIGGTKTFENNRMVVGRSTDKGSAIQFVNADVVGDSANGASGFEVYGSSVSDANKIGGITIGEFSNNGGSYATIECNRTVSGVKTTSAIRSLIRPDGSKELSATTDNDCKLGTEFLRWSKVYATNYYYGNDNVEFSTKFVTTDTAQTVGGQKTFSENIICFSNSDAKSIICKTPLSTYDSTNTVGDNTKIRFLDKNNNSISYIMQRKLTNGNTDLSLNISNTDSNNQPIEASLTFVLDSANEPRLSPGVDNTISIGRPTFRYKSIYATNYYYGSNNVEFSTKFVTTDTDQTVSGNKTFSSNVNVYNSDNTADTANIVLKNSKVERGSTTDVGEQNISFVDKNNNQLGNIKCITNSSGVSNMYITCNASGSDRGVRLSRSPSTTYFRSSVDNDCKLGTPDVRWSDVQTYKVNALEPSALSLPSGNLNDIIDISSYLTDLTGSNANTYIAPANGWISITMSNSSGIQAFINGLWGHQIVRPSVGGIRFLMPILKDKTVNIVIFGGTIDNARFMPCQGNV